MDFRVAAGRLQVIPQVHFFGASLSCCQRTARALESLGPVEGETSRWTTLRRFGLTLLMLPPSQRFRFRSAAERSRATESSREQIIILHYTKDTRGTKTSTPNFSVAAQELCSFAGIFRSVLFQRCVPAKLPCMGCMECACSIRTSSLKLAGAVSESAKLQQIATEYFPTARTFSLAEYSPGRFEFLKQRKPTNTNGKSIVEQTVQAKPAQGVLNSITPQRSLAPFSLPDTARPGNGPI